MKLIKKASGKRKKKNPIEIFNKDQARMIIDRIKMIGDISYRVMLLIPFFTGMRYSEIKALNKKNIDLKNRIIVVKEKQTQSDKNPIDTLKTNASKRKIPILRDFLPIIEQFIRQSESDYIIKNIISYKILTKLRIKISKELQIPFRYHDARHYFASLLINYKYDFKTIQTILGHEDIRFTFNVYGHIIDTFKAEEFDRIQF